MMATLNPSMKPSELETWFESVDENRDGVISRAEILTYLSSAQFQMSPFVSRCMMAFASRDSDAAGYALMEGVTSPQQSASKIPVKERESGIIVDENIPQYIKTALQLMFKNKIGRTLSSASKKYTSPNTSLIFELLIIQRSVVNNSVFFMHLASYRPYVFIIKPACLLFRSAIVRILRITGHMERRCVE